MECADGAGAGRAVAPQRHSSDGALQPGWPPHRYGFRRQDRAALEVETGRALAQPLPHHAAVSSAQFSLDGRWIVTVARDGTARVWDAETGKPGTARLKPGRGVSSAHFSLDTRRVVTISAEYNARVWDAQTGKELTGPLEHGSGVASAQFSPDGKRIVTASTDHTARVWDAETGQPLAGPLQHDARVTWAQFSPDGHSIVTASEDKTARVWDAESGQPLTEPLPHAGLVAMALFSPDSRQLLSISGNEARIWDIAPSSGGCPDWLTQLAEVVSGEVLSKRGLLELTTLNRADTINRIRETLSGASVEDDWVVWGRWFLADRAPRTISPFTKLTATVR